MHETVAMVDEMADGITDGIIFKILITMIRETGTRDTEEITVIKQEIIVQLLGHTQTVTNQTIKANNVVR